MKYLLSLCLVLVGCGGDPFTVAERSAPIHFAGNGGSGGGAAAGGSGSAGGSGASGSISAGHAGTSGSGGGGEAGNAGNSGNGGISGATAAAGNGDAGASGSSGISGSAGATNAGSGGISGSAGAAIAGSGGISGSAGAAIAGSGGSDAGSAGNGGSSGAAGAATGGQGGESSDCPSAAPRFVCTMTTALDTTTGLTWERGALQASKTDAQAHCQGLGMGWRFPHIASEFQTIDPPFMPKTDPAVFDQVPSPGNFYTADNGLCFVSSDSSATSTCGNAFVRCVMP